MGVFPDPTACISGAEANANCASPAMVMWSPYSTYSSAWGCRCCHTGYTTSAHAVWDLYTMPSRRRRLAEEDADLPEQTGTDFLLDQYIERSESGLKI